MFSTPENLLLEISGALGMIENHFLSSKCVLRKCCGVSQKQWMLELSNLCHCVQYPWKLTGRDYWSSKNDKKNVFWENAVGVSQKQWMLELSNLSIVFSTPENLLLGISGALGMKEMFWENVVLRKCCGVSQKWWMLELSNLCHCVQHPWKLTGRGLLEL